MNLINIQEKLKAMALYNADIDGCYGSKTDDAIEALFANQRVVGFESWPNFRQQIAKLTDDLAKAQARVKELKAKQEKKK